MLPCPVFDPSKDTYFLLFWLLSWQCIYPMVLFWGWYTKSLATYQPMPLSSYTAWWQPCFTESFKQAGIPNISISDLVIVDCLSQTLVYILLNDLFCCAVVFQQRRASVFVAISVPSIMAPIRSFLMMKTYLALSRFLVRLSCKIKLCVCVCVWKCTSVSCLYWRDVLSTSFSDLLIAWPLFTYSSSICTVIQYQLLRQK